jgi:hypothetical protein
MVDLDKCIQVPGDPTIYRVRGTERVGYRSWGEYEADGKPPVTEVTAGERDQYELVAYFTDEFEHLGKASAAKALISRWKIPRFPNVEDLLACSLAACRGELLLEFGILTGATVNVIASQVGERPVYGFDSFEGLPENWGPGFRKGAFKTNRLPVVLPNVEVVPGWFEDVLPQFLEEHSGQVAFAHIDSDVYSSARYVLATLADAGRLREGTVIQFDEIFAIKGPLWYRSEYDAFREFIGEYRARYRWLGYAGEAAALYIEKVNPRSAKGG